MNRDAFSSPSMKPLMMTLAGLFTVILAFAVAREQGILDPDVARRVVAMGFGVMLLIIGNALPKLVRPLRTVGNDPSRVMAADRFAGRIFVLAGTVFVALWAFAPAEHVMLISALVGLAAFGLVAVSQAMLSRGSNRVRGKEAGDGHAAANAETIMRLVLIYLLHGLLWVFAMFLADSIWGDRAALWMVAGCVLANGALILAHHKSEFGHEYTAAAYGLIEITPRATPPSDPPARRVARE